MNLFSCFTCQRMEKKSNDGFKEGNCRSSSNNGSQVFQWFQEPFVIARQISFGSLNDVLNRPKIFPESYPHRRPNSRIHHRSHRSHSRSEQSYRVSPSFPPLGENDIYPIQQKNDDMHEFLREFNQDLEFIDNITREIMKAKRAIDDEIYQELRRRRP